MKPGPSDARPGRSAHLLLLALGLLWLMTGVPGVAGAAEYKSIGAEPAILYDAPTTRGRKLWVAPRGMPVEIVVAQSDWVRVRDQSGELSWVEKRFLSDRHTVVAIATANVHTQPSDQSPVASRVAPGVWLDLLEPPANEFAHVRHRDGSSGWVRITDLWGL